MHANSSSTLVALVTLHLGASALLYGCSSTPSGGAGGSGGADPGAGLATGGADSSSGAASSGAGGTTSTGGAGSTSGGGTAAGGTTTTSAGCDIEPTQDQGTWVESMVDVNGEDRAYSTHLPENYDPSRAYPVILLLHGCGSGTNNLPMENTVGSDAIVMRGTGSRDDGCWLDTPTGDDMDYIDAMIADVKARFCADTSQFFAVGYSSGSWVVNQLACVRPSVFRGLASVTGGEPPLGDCTDEPVARIFVHDANDTTNLIAWSRSARDRMLETNQCDDPPTTTPKDPSPCVSYDGCLAEAPLVWCETSGQGHSRQDTFAAPLFWDFFQEVAAN